MSVLPQIKTLAEFEEEVSRIVKPPYQFKFKPVRWHELDSSGPTHEWLIKNMITRGEVCMLAGPSQSGKSFLAIDLAMAIARALPWFGHRVIKGLVIYQAGESAKGVRRRRLPAYRQAHGLSAADDIPFVMLSSPVNLYAGDDETNQLIAEIKAIAIEYADPLELVVIDTYAAATPGADENSAKDMTAVLARCHRISQECGCAVLLVHHMNAAGEKPRGHTSIFANLDSVLICKLAENQRDDAGRKIRELTIAKMKDGESDVAPMRFVLKGIEIGRDSDGEAVTSCVIDMPERYGADAHQSEAGLELNDNQQTFLKAVYSALERNGVSAPAELGLPPHARVVEWKFVKERFEATSFEGDDEDKAKRSERIKKALQRYGSYLLRWNVIARDKAHDRSWVWLTGRKVRGFRTPGYAAPASNETARASAPSEEIPD